MATNFEVTGLKTGSTSLAKYCLSATAKKDGVELIAAIMAAPDYKTRFQDAVSLLNYGYGNCKVYRDENPPKAEPILVHGGVEDSVEVRYREPFTFLALHGENFDKIEKKILIDDEVEAPITEGDVLGHLVYQMDGQEIGRVEILAAQNVEEAGFFDYWKKVWKNVVL